MAVAVMGVVKGRNLVGAVLRALPIDIKLMVCR